MISRRKLFGMLAGAAGSLLLPELALSNRSIFLPPMGGWPHGRIAHASLIIPRSDIHMWAEGLASGKYHYDIQSEVLSLMEFDLARADPPSPVNNWDYGGVELDKYGNWAHGGARPIVYSPTRKTADDASELRKYADSKRTSLDVWTDDQITEEYLRLC